jgi:hypothetical protein
VRTLTDRYVAATLTGVPESQRTDVDRELRASIADAMDARVDAGTPEVEAERAVLTELGDPVRLSASYADRTLHLIGPDYYVAWRHLLVTLLWTVVPVVAVVAFAVHALTEGAGPAWLSRSFAAALVTAGTTGLHVAFWITLAFSIIERHPGRAGGSVAEWTLEQLPVVDRKPILPEVVASVVFTLLFIGAIIWQQFAPIAVVDGEVVPEPLLDPAQWSFWIPFLLVVLAASIPLTLAVYRRGGWEYWSAAVKVGLDIAFAVPVAILAARGELFNRVFFDAVGRVDQVFPSGAGASGPDDALRIAGGILTAFGVVIVVWDAIDLGRKANRTARVGALEHEGPSIRPGHDPSGDRRRRTTGS